jgi:hypothetical protein
MPLATLILSAIFAGLARAEPRRENLILSRLPYATNWIGAVVIVAIVHLWIVYTLVTTVRGAAPIDPTRLVFVLVGAMIAIAGGQLGKLRSNFMMGIRTPWTLASDQVWDRTHRLARWPAMLVGFAIVLAALAAGGDPAQAHDRARTRGRRRPRSHVLRLVVPRRRATLGLVSAPRRSRLSPTSLDEPKPQRMNIVAVLHDLAGLAQALELADDVAIGGPVIKIARHAYPRAWMSVGWAKACNAVRTSTAKQTGSQPWARFALPTPHCLAMT